MDCFVGMLVALMGVNTVNLTQLALTFPSQAKPSSKYPFLFGFATTA
jgi:hypothetical protein